MQRIFIVLSKEYLSYHIP